MKVNPVLSGIVFKRDNQQANRRGINRNRLIPYTGYASLGFGIASAVFGYRKNIVVHKVAAMVAFVAAMAHILLLKTMHLVAGKQKNK